MNPAAICQALLMVRVVADPFASFVRSLLHLNTDLSDSATPATTWNTVSGAVITNTPAKVLTGGGSLDCQASSSARISASGTVFDLGTSDFCVECWFLDEIVAGRNTHLWLLQGNATGETVRVYSPTAGGELTVDANGGAPVGTAPYARNAWQHSAVTRSGSNWTHWINGTAAQTWTNATFNTGASGTVFWLGSASSAGSGLCCIIDEFRYTVGTPRYTAPFTPSFPFPNP